MADRNVRKDSPDTGRIEPQPPASRGRLERLLSLFTRLFERFGWFYLLGFGVAMLAVIGFGWLATEVIEQDLRPINEEILLYINRVGGRDWDPIARGVTDLGSVIFVTIMGVILGGIFLYRRRILDAATLVIVLIGGGLLSTVLKIVFQQERPRLFSSIVPLPPDYSFPSGHSLISFCLYGFFAAWLVVDAPREPWRWLVAAVSLGIAALVAFSRLYLGVHWPTDVTAGMLIAVFWVSLCMVGRNWWTERSARRHERTG